MKSSVPHLNPIRPALITRLYKAIDQHRLSDAILLLTQQYGGNQLDPESRAAHFLQELREEGERMVFADKLHQAEELFALALALYDRFFPRLHFEGIAAARRLSELMSEENRDAELSRALDYAYEIVKRLDAVSRGENVAMPPNGAIADSLVRRHQIAAYVDIVAQRKVVGGAQTKALQVLVVEDNDEDAELVRDALASTDMLEIETQCSPMLSDCIERLKNGGIDVVVLDLTLPDSESLRTLQKVRERAPNVPVVVLTGHDDDDFAFRAIKSGAHDYLVKGRTNAAMVLRSVLRAAEDRFTPRIPETPSTQVNAVIEFAPNGMMHLSNDLTVFAMNSALVSLVGANWSGKLLTEIWPEFTADRLIEATEHGGGVQLNDLPLPPSSVHKGKVDLSIWPTRTQEGITDGMICMVMHYQFPPVASFFEAGDTGKTKQLEVQLQHGRQEEQKLRDRVAQQTALAGISQIAQLNIESEDELFQHAMMAAVDAVGADVVLLMQREEDLLKVRSSSGDISQSISKLEGNIDFEPLYHYAYNASQALIINDFAAEPFARPPKALLDLGIKSGVMVHIKGREERYGLLCAFYKEPHRSHDDEVLFLSGLAGIIAAAIERKLVDDQLEQLTTELKRSNADLQQFAYAAAHDLQEPLRSVVSYLELLYGRLEGTLDEKSDKYIHVAMAAGKRMQGLINDLLEYSRISTRGQAQVRSNLTQLVKYAEDNLSNVIAETNAKIHLSELPVLPVDASQMVQLFQNLIGNALKFRKPEVTPEISIYAEEKEREWEFVVKDNGIGIEMEYAERIFIIFQRLHTRQKYGGTGIGLALCKKIIERHGGRIWIESKTDQGSEFHFTIPTRG
jgi:signal transduction histidine kinase/CheY-like chemotaxis protein